jgi:PAS domain S-box-containing protein
MAEIIDPSKLGRLQAESLLAISDGGGAAAEHETSRGPLHERFVRFYEDDAHLCEAAAEFIASGLRSGEPVLVITTEPHRRAFERRLEAEHLEAARAPGRLTFLDARETVAKVLRNGEPDPELFRQHVAELVGKLRALADASRIRVYGEMMDVLWAEGRRSAALQLEELWNDLQRREPAGVRCAYAMASFYNESALQHARVARTDAAVADDRAALPRYAHELALEIARRSEVELALREALRELRSKEEQLRASEAQLRDLVENAALGLHQVGPDGKILWANRAQLDLLGYSRDEYIGRSAFELYVDKHVLQDIFVRLSRGEELHDYEARMRAKDGSIKHVLINSNVHARDGRFLHTRCFMRDVTERRQAEEALKRHERQLQTITDALPVLVAFVGIDRRYGFVSAAYERWFGRPRAEIVGLHVEEALGAPAYEVIQPYLDQALAGQIVTYEAEVPYRDGGPRFVNATYIPQFDDDRVTGVVSLVVDNTERRSFELFRAAAAMRAERLLKITSALADAVTPAEVFEAVVDHVGVAVDASTAALWLVDDDGRTARLVRSTGLSAAEAQAFQLLSLDASPSIPPLDAIHRGQPVWIASQRTLLREYPHLEAVMDPGRPARVSCLPLISEGKTRGVLGLTIEESREAIEGSAASSCSSRGTPARRSSASACSRPSAAAARRPTPPPRG